MPMMVAFSGAGSSNPLLSRRWIVDTARLAKEVYAYLWNGSGAADPIPAWATYVRERFAAILASNDPEVPPGTFEPLIEHVPDRWRGYAVRQRPAQQRPEPGPGGISARMAHRVPGEQAA